MTRPNVLFLPVDDLRPQLACYGHEQMITPHLDKLAGRGVLFRSAYCQVPVCGASRASLLTGARPTRTRFVTFKTLSDDDLPGALTLPQHFRQNGYTTVALGKVFHHGHDAAERSWTRGPWQPEKSHSWRDYQLEENIRRDQDYATRGAPYECAEGPDDMYADGKIADAAVAELHKLKESGEPFFLAAGFKKPHLPFNAPKKYWDYYPENRIELAANPFKPENAPDQAMHNWGELRAYFDVPREGDLSEEMARTLIHGYYAATSYVDAQIGRVLTALEETGLAENTVVVVWGDHGWQLGEHGLWCKHCNFDTSLHAPLILRTPDGVRDRVCESVVEFVDIYPTLADLAGLPLPEHLDGVSLEPLASDPSGSVKDAAFGRYHDGDSVFTGRHLYTEWRDDTGAVTARMLYDHQADPAENVNIAENPENAGRVAQLSAMLPASA